MTTPADVLENFWAVWGYLITNLWPLWLFMLFLLGLSLAQTIKDWIWERSAAGQRHHSLLKSLVQPPSTEQEFSALKSSLRRARRDSLKGSPDVGESPYLK